MKPILFNTKMVRAILDGRKTATRRVLKNQDENAFYADSCEDEDYGCVNLICENADGTKYVLYNKAPYQPGDILYVRETFFEFRGKYYYKADGKHLGLNALIGNKEFFKWRPSIHMPKEAARLFLRVTGVRVERLQNIQERGTGSAQQEGFINDINLNDGTGKSATKYFADVWDDCYASPQPVRENGKIVRYESYPWEDIRETRTYRGLPWLVIGNPWIWVVEFERISKEEALKNE